MRREPIARRVITVVLDGLRPDAIERFELAHLGALIAHGASALDATTVSPSVTVAAMTSSASSRSGSISLARRRPGGP
jgi:predicted AlkP superfamily pyrophosphatase or phosphodiesterase